MATESERSKYAKLFRFVLGTILAIGVRARINTGSMRAESVVRLALAAGRWFADKTADDLLAVLLAEEMQPMRQACRVWAEEADLAAFAERLFDPQRVAA